MTIEVEVTNKSQDPNDEKVVIVRTYTNHGNTADDGELLQAGESTTRCLHDSLMIQVDECVNPNYENPNGKPFEPPQEEAADGEVMFDADPSKFYAESADGEVMFDPENVVTEEQAEKRLAVEEFDDVEFEEVTEEVTASEEAQAEDDGSDIDALLS